LMPLVTINIMITEGALIAQFIFRGDALLYRAYCF